MMHVQSYCFAYKTYCFFTFSLPSASLDVLLRETYLRQYVNRRSDLNAKQRKTGKKWKQEFIGTWN